MNHLAAVLITKVLYYHIVICDSMLYHQFFLVEIIDHLYISSSFEDDEEPSKWNEFVKLQFILR